MTGLFKKFAAVIILLTMINGAQAAPPVYQIYTADGRLKGVETLVGLVRDYDVIIFGEYHDNAVLHTLELRLLINAFKEHPKLAVSLEMFERDVQEMLDWYLRDEIPEAEFLEKSRPWGNYQEDYRPLVEFAKNNSLPVLASNIPRYIAAQYAREGSLDKIADEMKIYLPQVHSAPKGDYWRNFEGSMKSKMGGKMPVTADKIYAFYKAQCLKDDTMAESIAGFSKMHPGYKVIHYQGDFHSRGRLGVVEKLSRIAAHLKVAVIAPLYAEDFGNIPTLLKQHENDGDFIIFLK